jgi:hypothetical protein
VSPPVFDLFTLQTEVRSFAAELVCLVNQYHRRVIDSYSLHELICKPNSNVSLIQHEQNECDVREFTILQSLAMVPIDE